jgi:integrating conjugative element relaxase (TIGR03760 family)
MGWLTSLFGTTPAAPPPVAERRTYADIARCEWKPVLAGSALIDLLDLSGKLRQIRELMSIPESDWKSTCVAAIHNFAEAVQLAPASEVHHHAFVGGLLVHTLDAVVYALTLRRRYQLPAGVGAEKVNEAALRWSYGVFAAVLLHDPGKVGAAVVLEAETADGMVRWSPLNGSMHAHGVTRYRLGFRKAPYRLHNQIATALFSALIPESGRRWISVDQDLLEQVLAAVYDVHSIGAGAIGEILVQADGMSVAHNLGQPFAKHQTTGAKSIPLVDKYMRTLRQLLADQKFVLNKPGAQVFVCKKRQQTDADADVWVLCRAAAEAIVKTLRQSDPTVPTQIELVYDTLQEFGMCEPTREGRAIWQASVHCGEWSAEFSLLRFRASRLYAATKVPESFAGAVKPRKTGATASLTAPIAVTHPAPGEVLDTVRTTNAHTEPMPDPDTASAVAAHTAPNATNPAPVPQLERTATLLTQILTPRRANAAHTGTKSAAHTGPTASNKHNAPTGSTGIAASDAFFAWIGKQLLDENVDINSTTAMLHTHEDGLLLVTPKVFKQFCGEDWMPLQAAVTASGYVLTRERKHVHAYKVQDAKGVIAKRFLNCIVLVPAAVKALFHCELPEPNPSIIGRA